MDEVNSSHGPRTTQFLELLRARAPRTRWLEWSLLSALVLAGVALLSTQRGVERLDRVLQDLLQQVITRPVSPDVIIVAIDDQSLHTIGRWPWRRAFHAALLERLAEAKPRAIGLDLILGEPETDDALLAQALRRAGQVVLPLTLAQLDGARDLRALPPAGELARSARALAHIHLEIDGDGIVRSAFLREGPGSNDPAAWTDHLALALLRVGGQAPAAPLPGQRRDTAMVQPSDRDAWARDHWVQIPFTGPPGSIERVSYVDVLQGRVPPERFRGKYVLVGATAQGMGDAYPTPYSSRNDLMPGVEISANLLNALLLDQRLRPATSTENLVASLIPVVLALLAVVLLSPTLSLLASGALIGLCLVATWVGIRHLGVLPAPACAMLGIALTYPLWSWRRQIAAVRYLLEEFRRMEIRRDLPPLLEPLRSGDLLDRRIDALRHASEQLRNLHRFVSDTIDSLPDPTLIASSEGQVLMANQAARQYFRQRDPQAQALRGQSLMDLLGHVRRADTGGAVVDLELLRHSLGAWGGEARDDAGRDLLFKCAPCLDVDANAIGWVASLVDITPIRQAERQRDEALRFITHDMRSPQSSILALLALQRLEPDAPITAELLSRIERHARRTLNLAEDFVQLARAESGEYRFGVVDVSQLLEEAIDDVWAQAQSRHVRFTIERPATPALCRADRSMLIRAIVNLLGNAVKFSPEHAHVDCAVRQDPRGWRLSVSDRGPGMTREQQDGLFRPFGQVLDGPRRRPGVGLGLVFTRTVVDRHGSRLELDSQPGVGTCFSFTLAPARE